MRQFVALIFLQAILSARQKKLKHQKGLRRPGIEPGSTAWKAAMLTTIPPTLFMGSEALVDGPLLKQMKRKKCQKCRDQDSNLGYCGHNAGS